MMRLPLTLPWLSESSAAYGTSYLGGRYGYGTVFELKPESNGWKEKLSVAVRLKRRSGPRGRGRIRRERGPVQHNQRQDRQCIARLMPKANDRWKEAVLYGFKNPRRGFAPVAGVVFDNRGNLYGTTAMGGNGSCYDGCGVVYKLAPRAGGKWEYTVLYDFDSRLTRPRPTANS